MKKKSMREVVETIKKNMFPHIKRKITDEDVASILRLTRNTIVINRKRNVIPYKEIISFCANRGINPLDILYERERIW
ncbi:MAG: hypothetical protein PHI02_06260 [Sulfurovaceae bacterium]|nr:hypothetical protein [Sulfurovaceae bacterium]